MVVYVYPDRIGLRTIAVRHGHRVWRWFSHSTRMWGRHRGAISAFTQLTQAITQSHATVPTEHGLGSKYEISPEYAKGPTGGVVGPFAKPWFTSRGDSL